MCLFVFDVKLIKSVDGVVYVFVVVYDFCVDVFAFFVVGVAL